jgi:hypothetical protein
MAQIKQSIYRIEHVGLRKFGFKVSTSSHNNSSNVHFIVDDKHLRNYFRHFAHVVVPLLHAQTGETKRRLTTST